VNLESSASTFSISIASPAFTEPVWLPSPERRRLLTPALIVLLSAAAHLLLASWAARSRAHDGRPFKPLTHVHVTVARPPAPPKPAEVPVAVAPPPKSRPVPVVKKKLVTPVVPIEQPKTEAPPPPAEPVLATTEATEPGAVIGSAEGSLTGTGVEGGVKGGTGAIVAPPPPPPVIQAHEGAGYLRNPRPAYPELARSRGWEGEVLLKVRVAATGRAEAVAVKRSSGRSLLDDAAKEAVKGWTFVPATQGGVAIPGWVEVPLVFKLQ